MIEDTREPDQIECPVRADELVDISFNELESLSEGVFTRDPLRLPQVQRFDLDPQNMGAALRKLQAVEPRIAADIEHRPARHILRHYMLQLVPFELGKIAEAVLWRSLRTVG